MKRLASASDKAENHGKLKREEKRKKGGEEKQAMFALLYFLNWLLWRYNHVVRVHVHLQLSTKKNCLIEEVFSGVTFSNVQLDVHLNVFLCSQYVVYAVCFFKCVLFGIQYTRFHSRL